MHFEIQLLANCVDTMDHIYYLHCNSLLLLANFQLTLRTHICKAHASAQKSSAYAAWRGWCVLLESEQVPFHPLQRHRTTVKITASLGLRDPQSRPCFVKGEI